MESDSLGQLILTGVPGYELDSKTAALFRRLQPGGFILFGRNIKSAPQLRKLIDDLRDLSEIEPIITIDQEGGLVKRLDGPPDHSPAEIGRDGSSKLARHEGRATGGNLRDVGVNVNFAPVVDVARPGSIMEKEGRSYSRDASKVAGFGPF